jgi:hypothetical protein
MSLSDVVVGGEVRYVFSQGKHLLTKGGGGGGKKGSISISYLNWAIGIGGYFNFFSDNTHC